MSDFKKVTLYIYDLSMGLASQLSMGMVGKHFEGIWHTGIVVYHTEYFFGGGIQRMAPGMTPYGTPVKKIELGSTSLDKDIFDQFVHELSRNKFRPDRYHLFENNCNNFTDEAAKFLLGGSGIPDNIKSLPMEFFQTDMGRMIRPMVDSMMGGSDHPMTGAGGMGSGGMGSMGGMGSGMGGGGGNAFGGGGGGGAFGGGDAFGGMGGMNDDMASRAMQMMNNPQMMQEAMNNPMVQNAMSQYGLNGMDLQGMMNQMGGPQNMMNMMNQMRGQNSMQGMMNQMNHNNNAPTPTRVQPPAPTEFKDNQSIIRYEKANVAQVMTKLRSILSEHQFQLGVQEEVQLSNLQQFLASTTTKNYNLISEDTIKLLKRMIDELPEKSVFPVLDLVRLLVQTSAIVDRFLLNSDLNLIEIVGNKYLENWADLSMPTQLMVLRMYCNMFPATFDSGFVPQSVKLLTSSEKYSKLVDIITSSLTSKLEALRLTAASLASNLSLYTSKDGNDEETQLLCSMGEFCAGEASNEIKQRMLTTVYRICKGNANAISLMKELDYPFDRMVSGDSPSDLKLLIASIKVFLK